MKNYIFLRFWILAFYLHDHCEEILKGVKKTRMKTGEFSENAILPTLGIIS